MANTRITQGVIKPNEDYDTRHINATGIVTAASVDITNNLSVGGVLTYEDVTNVDSVGINTTTPQGNYALYVQGDANITGTINTNGNPVATAGDITALAIALG